MTHLITKEQYVNNPCRVCSTAFWKNSFFKKPDGVQIFHENEESQIDENVHHVTRYFRLIHKLRDIENNEINSEYYFQTVNIPTQKETVSKIINSCYENTDVTPERVDEWSKYSVFDNDLWVFIIENKTKIPVALGIADFDRDINEGSLEWIQVLPEKRSLGLGHALVIELLLRLKKKADFVTVSGISENKSNPESLYRKCGFTGNDIWCVIHTK